MANENKMFTDKELRFVIDLLTRQRVLELAAFEEYLYGEVPPLLTQIPRPYYDRDDVITPSPVSLALLEPAVAKVRTVRKFEA